MRTYGYVPASLEPDVQQTKSRSSHPEVFLGKSVLKICSKVTGEHLCRSVIPRKFAAYFQSTFSYEYFWTAASEKGFNANNEDRVQIYH